MNEALESRTAAEIERFAARMDYLREQYRRDCALGIEGPRSVPRHRRIKVPVVRRVA